MRWAVRKQVTSVRFPVIRSLAHILALILWFVPVLSQRNDKRNIDQWTWDAFVEIKRLRAQDHTCYRGGVSTFFPAIKNDLIKFDCKSFHTEGDEDEDQDQDEGQGEEPTPLVPVPLTPPIVWTQDSSNTKLVKLDRQTAGEVYTYCRACDGATAVNKWLQSKTGHCNAILNATATLIGIAHYYNPNARFKDYGAAILSKRELESDTMCHCERSGDACQN